MKLFRQLSWLVLPLCLCRCDSSGSSQDRQSAAAKGATTTESTAVPTSSTSPSSSSHLRMGNTLAGSWTIHSFPQLRDHTSEPVQTFRTFMNGPNRVHLRIEDHDTTSSHGGIVTLIVDRAGENCQVQFTMSHVYCCDRMRRITLTPNEEAAQESQVGCSLHMFGETPAALKTMITAGLVDSTNPEESIIYHFMPHEPVVIGWEGRQADRRWVLLRNPPPAELGAPVNGPTNDIFLVED